MIEPLRFAFLAARLLSASGAVAFASVHLALRPPMWVLPPLTLNPEALKRF